MSQHIFLDNIRLENTPEDLFLTRTDKRENASARQQSREQSPELQVKEMGSGPTF